MQVRVLWPAWITRAVRVSLLHRWAHVLLFLSFVGGGLGSVARFALGDALVRLLPAAALPWWTLAVNVIGSAAIGAIAAVPDLRAEWRALLAVGFCGGFTTFSAFSLELLSYVQQQRPARAAVYVALSLAACVTAAALGHLGVARARG